MDGTTHALRLTALAAALAAMLLLIPLANAGQRTSRPGQDGWYYSVLHAGKSRAARTRSSCQASHTYQQAVEAGDLPAIIAALHGGGPVTNGSDLNC